MDPIFEKYRGEPGVKIGDYDTIRHFVEQDARYEWNTDDEYASSSTEEGESTVEEVPLRLQMTHAVCPLTTVRGNVLRHAPETQTLDDMEVLWENDAKIAVRVPWSGWTLHQNDKMYVQNVRGPMALFQYKNGQKVYKEYDYGLYGEIEMIVGEKECTITLSKEYLL